MSRRYSYFARIVFLFILMGAYLHVKPAQAAVPAGFSEFFIPGTTDQLFWLLRNNDNDPQMGNANLLGLGAVGTCATGTGECNEMHSVITVVIAVDNTTVYFDHWENGYGSGSSSYDERYQNLNKGTVLVFESSDILVPRSAAATCTSTFPSGGTPGGPATSCYDGGDRIYAAGGAISVAQAFWPEVNDTVYANAWEIYPVKPYQTTYVLPVGEDLFAAPRNYSDFDNVYVLAQATTNGTTITIDDPLVAGVQVTATLNKGQTTEYLHANTGTTITGSNPIQVQFIVGKPNSGQASESRSYTAVPSGLWDTAYYAPVPSANTTTEADIYMYNPTASNLVLNYQDRLGSGSITIPAGSTRSYSELVGREVPTTSSVYLAAANGTTEFWAIGSYDTENADYNYGFSLIPASTLEADYFIGWAPGTTDYTANGSPVFVTSTQDNTTIFVDYSPTDGVVDATYTIDRIQVQVVRDTVDNNNTGMHIWATSPIALVWGEDDTYSDIGNPYIDAGYAILPLKPEWIDIVLTLDKTSNPTSVSAAAGQVSQFTVVFDVGAYGLDDVYIEDVLPTSWAYIPGTTNISWPGGSSTADPSGGTGPNLAWGSVGTPIADLLPNQTLTLTYQAQTTAVPANYSINTATGVGTYAGQTFEASGSTTVVATQPDLSVTKTNNVVSSALAGVPFTWTLEVLNSSSGGMATFTSGQVVLRDNLPAGPTYGSVTVTNGSTPPGGTGSLNCSIAANVLTCSASGGTVTLPTGASFRAAFPVTPASAGTLNNPATGGANVCRVDPDTVIAESDETNNNCSNSVTVVASALSMTKTANPAGGTTVNPGAPITYTITVNNIGGTTQNNIVVNDALPAGTTYVAQSTSVTASATSLLGTAGDAFTSNSVFTGNQDSNGAGTDPTWVGDWIEVGEADGAGSGDVQVTGNRLQIQDNDNSGEGVLRDVDLSSCTSATLSFSYQRVSLDDANDYVRLSIGPSGTLTTTLNDFVGPADDSASQSYQVDITSYLSAQTRIQLLSSANLGGSDQVFFANVLIECYTLASYTKDNIPGGGNDLSSGVPSTLVTSLDDFDLPAGQSMTVTYQVTVNNPTTETSVVNTAYVSSDEQLQPISSSTTHPITTSTDLTVAKSNNVSGSVALGSLFNWTINVSNTAGSATFASGQTIMSDPLPGIAGYYPQGALTVTNGAPPPTGTIGCSITGTALSCVASGGSVTLPAGASFSVTFAVTPTAAGSLANTATVDPNTNVTESNEANNTGSDTVTVVAPPTILKSFGTNPIVVNGTSVITFTITNPVANTVALTGVNFTDTYPAGLQNAAAPAASTTCVAGTVTAAANGPSVSLSGATLAVNTSCTVTVTVTGTTSGTKTNSVTVGSTNGGTGNTSIAKLGVISAAKSVAATSEDSTSGNNVAIGEVVRYRLVIDLPEGTTTNLQFLDNLVANLAYLNDGSTRVAFICNSGAACGSSSTAAIGTNPVISGNSVVAPAFALPAAAITNNDGGATGNPFPDGDNPMFSLGNVTNNDNDADAEYVVVEFNVIVRNVLANQDGNSRGNTFTVNVNGAVLTTTTSGVNDQITIREPVIGPITKSITTAPTDAGDTITYQLQFTNTGNAPAFDIVVTDALNTVLTTPVTVTGSTTGGACGSTASTVSGSFTAPNASATVTCLAAGGTATINISATVSNTALAGFAFNNSGSLVYTSLPGATGTPNGSGGNTTGSSNPGAAGTGNGERNGSGGTNDYTATSNVVNTTLANPSVAKTVNPAGTQYAVGATIPYQITITVPEGVTGNPTANLVDAIPAGLSYVAGSLAVTPQAGVTIGASGPYTDANAAFFNLTGQTMTLTFGSFTSTASGGATNRTVVVTLNARVNNVVGNQSGTTFTNSVDLVRTNPNGAGTLTLNATAPVVSAIEPVLNVAKAASTSTPLLGSTLTYTLTINHTGASNSPAYDARITDSLPAGLTGLTNVNVTSVGSCATGVTNNSTGTALDVTVGTIPLGCVITITYDVTVSGSVATIQTNNVNMTWTSLSGIVAGERTGADGVGGALNDYADSASVNVTVTDPATGVISDYVWNDTNGNGLQAGESGLGANIRVYVDSNNNKLYDVGEPNDLTDAGGLYAITSLAGGTHNVRVDATTLPAGFAQTYDLNGGLDHEASVLLNPAQTRTDVDFGYQQQNAVISDFVWNDLDGDGAQDGGLEVGLVGVRVYLDSNNNNTYDIGEPTSTTTAGGLYSINNLAAGTYAVRVDTSTLPAGYGQTYDLDGVGTSHEASVTITVGQVRTDVDFGYQQQNAVISDFVWNDLDGDGVQDGGLEVGLNGVRAYVDSNNNNTYDVGEPAATTNASGNYSITGLAAGTYPVRVDTTTLPAGYNETFDLDGVGTSNEASVTLTAGQTRTDVDFGYQQQNAVISDFVWNDLDADGVQDGGLEVGLDGVRVYIDANGNNSYDAGERTAVTAGGGLYSLTGLPVGTYDVRIDTTTLPAGFNPTYDHDGGNNNEASVAVTAGQARLDVDFGYQQQNAVISDFVWNDLNGDGVQDGGLEVGLTGVRVYLDQDNDDTYDVGEPTSVTNAGGNYSITGLPVGTYSVRIDTTTLPAGYSETYDLDGIGTSNEASVTVTAGQVRSDVDFGYQQQNAVISDFVWNDLDGDGAQDGGLEVGLNGVRVYVDNNNNNTYDVGEPASVTNASGNYSIGGLAAGTYAVRIDTVSLPAGYGQTYDLDGVGTSNEASVTLTAGQVRSDVDFGYQQQNAVVSDFVWNDLDGDGVQDGGLEIGLVGVRVYVDQDNDNTYDVGEPAATTNAAGNYSITGLAAGTYAVRVDTTTLPASYNQTYDLDGIGTSHESSVIVTAGEVRTDVDFSYQQQNALISDFVWNDLDGDGVQDGGLEVGLVGVRVYIDSDNDDTYDVGEPSTTTAAGGLYAIGNLAAGTYNVRMDTTTLPVGFVQTYDLNGGLDNEASVIVTTGQLRTDVDFGYQQQNAVISDFVWNDLDGDGVQDGGLEVGLNGVRVYIDQDNDDTYDVGEPTSTTAAGGLYSIGNLVAGTYSVRIDASTLPAGFNATNDPDGIGSLNEASITVTAGQVRSDVDFGYQQQNAVISDFVWNDLDGDGVQDGGLEVGLTGVRVYLDQDNDNTYDVGESTAITAAGGLYSIGNLAAGTYSVRVDTTTLPSGYGQTFDLDGVGTSHEATVVVTAGQTRTDVDFGYQQQDAVISDFVWNDIDGDGVQDGGLETGLVGVRVYIDSDNDNIYDVGEPTATTNASGNYSIGNLAAGTYAVRIDTVTLPAGYGQTYDLDGIGTLNEASVPVTAGQIRTDVDFGYQQQDAVVSDFVWNDLDGNGVQDGGLEVGLVGVRVYVDQDNDNTYDVGEPFSTTAAGGLYSIGSLPAGTHAVRVDTTTLPAGYIETYDLDGVGTLNEASVAVTAGQVRTDVDFGYQQQNAMISDFVWNDLDGDGVQDGGLEVGLTGVRVYIDGNGNNTYDAGERTGTTNGSGNYSITGLALGTYDMRIDTPTLPVGYSPTYDLDGGNNHEASVSLTAGQVRTDVDFGYQQQADVSGHLYYDVNGNGTQDVGEPDLSNVDVRITPSTGAPFTVTTNSSGNWTASVPPGSTTADVDTTDADFTSVVPVGFIQTEGTDPTTLAAAAGVNTFMGNDGYFTPNPALNIVKEVATSAAGPWNDVSVTVNVGETVFYRIRVSNTGNITLTNLVVDDGMAGCTLSRGADLTGDNDNVFEVGEEWLYTCSITAVVGTNNNTATVDTTETPQDSDNASYTANVIPAPALNVIKDGTLDMTIVVPNARADAGDVINYTVSVENLGNVTLTGVLVSDPLLGNLDCDGTPGAPFTTSGLTINIAATLACTGSYTLTQADLDTNGGGDGDIDNTATADSNETGPDSDPNEETLLLAPAIDVAKALNSATFNNPNEVRLTYAITVQNTGNVTLSNLQVSDDLVAAFPGAASFSVFSVTSPDFTINPAFDGTTDLNLLSGTNSLAVGASGVITIITDVDTGGDEDFYVNTAIGTGDGPDGTPVQDNGVAAAPGFVDPALTKAASASQASVGDTVIFTITVTNEGNVAAPNVVVTDTLPAMFDVTAVNVAGAPLGTLVNIVPAIGVGPAPYTVTVTIGGAGGLLGVADVITIQITTTVNSLGNPPIVNNAGLTTTAATNNLLNDNASVPITLGIGLTTDLSLPATGFAPGRVTTLVSQPEDLRYAATDVILEIPRLGLRMPIVGVPFKSGGWDVSWLGNQAGWLEGSAFPSWSGNSVLTGHVFSASGSPGPFQNLGTLKYGDQVIVHAGGEKYVFEIRSNSIVLPTDSSAFKHEELSWLTLITCKEYDPATDTYRKRVMVRAVLVDIE